MTSETIVYPGECTITAKKQLEVFQRVLDSSYDVPYESATANQGLIIARSAGVDSSSIFQAIEEQNKERNDGGIHNITGPCKCASCMNARMKDIHANILGNIDNIPGYCPEASSDPNIWDFAKRMRQL